MANPIQTLFGGALLLSLAFSVDDGSSQPAGAVTAPDMRLACAKHAAAAKLDGRESFPPSSFCGASTIR